MHDQYVLHNHSTHSTLEGTHTLEELGSFLRSHVHNLLEPLLRKKDRQEPLGIHCCRCEESIPRIGSQERGVTICRGRRIQMGSEREQRIGSVL